MDMDEGFLSKLLDYLDFSQKLSTQTNTDLSNELINAFKNISLSPIQSAVFSEVIDRLLALGQYRAEEGLWVAPVLVVYRHEEGKFVYHKEIAVSFDVHEKHKELAKQFHAGAYMIMPGYRVCGKLTHNFK